MAKIIVNLQKLSDDDKRVRQMITRILTDITTNYLFEEIVTCIRMLHERVNKETSGKCFINGEIKWWSQVVASTDLHIEEEDLIMFLLRIQ